MLFLSIQPEIYREKVQKNAQKKKNREPERLKAARLERFDPGRLAYELQTAGSGVKVRSQQGLVGKQHT